MTEIPNNELEFNKLMEEIDEALKKQSVPILGRQILAIREACIRLGISLSIVPRSPAIPGKFYGNSLSSHIIDWYDKKYGDRLKVDLGLGNGAIILKGDAWKITFPRFYGSFKFIFDPNIDRYKNFPEKSKGETYLIFNPLRCIDGLTSNFAITLEKQEIENIKQFFILGINAKKLLEDIKSKPLIPEAKTDMESSVSYIFSQPPHYGQSKWASLQFVEKLLKCYLELKRIKFKKTHDLLQLATLAEQHGLPPLPRPFIHSVQCPPSVRYGEPRGTLEEAVEAHHSALKICSYIAREIIAL